MKTKPGAGRLGGRFQVRVVRGLPPRRRGVWDRWGGRVLRQRRAVVSGVVHGGERFEPPALRRSLRGKVWVDIYRVALQSKSPLGLHFK